MSSQKVAVVTGGNKGIGFAIVKGLCEKFKGVVYLTARDISRGEEAVAELKKLGFNPVFHQLDITDKISIERFKNHLKEKHEGLDILINNAAIAFKETAPEPFAEQAKTTVDVNYFATLHLCEALFPLLRKNARVINVSSSAGHLSLVVSAESRAKLSASTLTVPQLNKLAEQFVEDAKNNRHKEVWNDSNYAAYIMSKVFLSALSPVQQKVFDEEVPNRNISVNSVHPGYVDTDLTNHKGPLTIEEGAVAPLWLALDAPKDVKGKYVWKDTTLVEWTAETLVEQY